MDGDVAAAVHSDPSLGQPIVEKEEEEERGKKVELGTKIRKLNLSLYTTTQFNPTHRSI